MNIAEREKRSLIAGGVIAVVALGVAYGIVPPAREWTRLGTVLRPKLEYVERLRRRGERQRALLAQRDELAAKLGSVLGPEGPRDRNATQQVNSPPPRPDNEGGAKGEPPYHDGGSAPPAGSDEGTPAPPPEEREPETANRGKAEGPDRKPGPQETKTAGPSPAPSGIGLAAHVERICKKSGVKVEKMNPRKPAACRKTVKHFQPVGLHVTFESNIQTLIKLLHALEKGDRLVRVEHAEFHRDPQKDQKMRVVLHVVGYESIVR